MPDRASVLTIFLDHVFPTLQKEIEVEIVWFVFQAKKQKITKNESGQKILQKDDFNDAVEVINKIKPDLIYITPTYDLINFPFNLVSKKFRIPSFFHRNSDVWRVRYPRNFTYRAKTYLSSFFENSLPTDTNDADKEFMKRGKFFLKKYSFLIKTQKALGQSYVDLFKMFFTIMKSILFYSKIGNQYNPMFEFLENNKLKDSLISDGRSEKGLEVVGHPLFDTAMNKYQTVKISNKEKEIIRVLFLPSTLVEHNFWNRKERDEQYKKIITKITENKEKIQLTIKVHPTTARLQEYKELVNPIDPSIDIIKEGNVADIIQNYDVIISERFSSAEMYGIIARKPIIMCNFFNLPYDILLEKKLAIECKRSEHLLEKIFQSLEPNKEYEILREEFLRESIYMLDGKAGERIAKKLLEIIKSFKNNSEKT